MEYLTQRLQRAPVWVFWGLSTLVLALALYRSRQAVRYGLDFVPNYRGARNLRMFGDPYIPGEHLPFVYPPSAALLFWPLGYLRETVAVAAGQVLGVLSLVAIGMSSAMVSGLRARGRASSVIVALLALSYLGSSTLAIGNASLPMAAGFAVALALAHCGNWAAAGAVMGVTLSVKPLVVLGLLAFLALRQWRGLVLAIGVPAVLNFLALPLLTRPLNFFTETIPALARGETLPLEYNLSVAAVVARAGGSSATSLLLRIAVVLLAAALLWRACTAADPLRLTVLATAPVIALALASSTDETHFTLVAVPVVVLLLVRGDHLARSSASVAALLYSLNFGFGQTTGQFLVLSACAAGVRHFACDARSTVEPRLPL